MFSNDGVKNALQAVLNKAKQRKEVCSSSCACLSFACLRAQEKEKKEAEATAEEDEEETDG